MLAAAPFAWSMATQTPRLPAEHAGTAAEEACTASEASTAPEELAAMAVVAISPATEAAAMTAAIRRAAVERDFISGRSCCGLGAAVCGVLLSVKTEITRLRLQPAHDRSWLTLLR